MRFRDRQDAARQLAQRLELLTLHDPLVLAVPRGGVVTGATIAAELGAELDVLLAHNLHAPSDSATAIGCVCEGGELYLDDEVQSLAGVTPTYLRHERHRQTAELELETGLFRSVCSAAAVTGRTIVLADDGIATGSTMLAAIGCLLSRDPAHVIVAVPVAPAHRIDAILRRCDLMICLHAPVDFRAVSQAYESFEEVDDERVIELLRQAEARHEIAT